MKHSISLSSFVIVLVQLFLMYYFTVNNIQLGLTILLVLINISSIIFGLIFILAIYAILKVCSVLDIKNQYKEIQGTNFVKVVACITQISSIVFFVYNGYVGSCVIYILMLICLYSYLGLVYIISKNKEVK